MALRIKRIYEPREADDGTRILIDRLWPRRVNKKTAGVDHWMRDFAPTPVLHRWFEHDPTKWTEFRRRDQDELRKNRTSVERLSLYVKHGGVTPFHAARDSERNHAMVLRGFIDATAS